MANYDAVHHDAHEHKQSFVERWFFSTNHKDIGTLYLVFSFIMFIIGAAMSVIIRWELMTPGLQHMKPEFFNQMTTVHALVMIFGGVMPAFVGLANWMVPLQIGAPDMALPRMNNWSFWILPAFGVASEIIPTFSRKPLFGYQAMVYATASIAFLSFIVWAHHMFTVGMPLGGEIYFMFATMLIAVPTGVKVFNWVTTMWRGSISFEAPMLWAIAFVILFTIGGFSGLMLAIVPADFQYHDTYFVVAHFHYVLVTGAVFSIIAAVYYWWPKWTGRMYSQTAAKFHFWWSVVFVNLLFFPQHFLGLAGMPRRIPDYNVVFADWNLVSSIGAFGMFLTPFMMFAILYSSLRSGAKATDRVWEAARGLEWTVASPAPHHTFTTPPVIKDGDLAHGDFAHMDFD